MTGLSEGREDRARYPCHVEAQEDKAKCGVASERQQGSLGPVAPRETKVEARLEVGTTTEVLSRLKGLIVDRVLPRPGCGRQRPELSLRALVLPAVAQHHLLQRREACSSNHSSPTLCTSSSWRWAPSLPVPLTQGEPTTVATSLCHHTSPFCSQ